MYFRPSLEKTKDIWGRDGYLLVHAANTAPRVHTNVYKPQTADNATEVAAERALSWWEDLTGSCLSRRLGCFCGAGEGEAAADCSKAA